MSHRYQVQDPTGQGFPQVVDTSAWRNGLRWRPWPPPVRIIVIFAGLTLLWGIASTAYPRAHNIEWAIYLAAALACLARWGNVGTTYVVASFTGYCPDAQAHAEALRDRLNEYSYIPPLDPRGPGDILIIDNAGEFSKRPISVATVSQKWCPHAQQEVATLLEFMNRYEIHMEGTGLRFTAVTLEDK
jgi:hypothetical protein